MATPAESAAALRKLQSGQTLTTADREALGMAPATTAPKTIANMTKAEIDAITASQVAAGGASNDQTLTIPGETNSQRNARITAGYKEMTAKPILAQEAADAGVTVQYVRTQAGGIGEYTAVKPFGYTGPDVISTGWTAGILPSNMKYTTGTSLGKTVTSNGTVTGTGNVTETGRVTNADGSVTIFYSNGTTRVIPKSTTVVTNGGNGNGNGNGSAVDTSTPTTNIEVLKSMLRGRGYNASLIDASASYLQQLLKDGLDYDNAVEVFLSSKDYTLKNGSKITSPFYEAYGFLNESAPKPLGANELYGFVEGTKSLVSKYGLNSKFASTEYMKKYISNQITVDDLEARANTARLKALESDTSYVEALKKLGFVTSAADLTDFFLDPNVGQETLIQNQRTGTFAAEAIRRASAGVEFNKTLAQQMAASYTAKGMNEAQISAAAAQGYQSIAESLQPTTKLSGIYDKTAAVGMSQIQSELEQEEFMGMESARRKRLKEMETKAYQGQSGTTQYSLRGIGTAGIL